MRTITIPSPAIASAAPLSRAASKRPATRIAVLAALVIGIAGSARGAVFLPAEKSTPDAEWVRQLEGKPADETFAIDDMLFRVGNVIQSGFTGPPWTSGVLIYEFDANVSATHRTDFLNAAAEWSAIANLTFRARTSEANYVHVQDSGANGPNNSFVGMNGGSQALNINSNNWQYRFVIAHEIGHALGLCHEHERSDRDSYIQIQTAYIQSGQEHNFDLEPASTNVGPYDFDSVMHYGQCAFSTDCPAGQACSCTHPTILVLPPNQSWQLLIGQRNHLSTRDQAGMASRYGCRVPPAFSSITLVGPPDGSALGRPVTLDWTDVPGAASYTVVVVCESGTATSHSQVGSLSQITLDPGDATFTWTVRAVTPAGCAGPPSASWSFTTGPCGVPTALVPADGATCVDTAGTLRWNEIPGVASYTVEFQGGAMPSPITVTQPWCSYSGFDRNRSVHWRVHADCACSPASGWSQFRTVPDLLTAPSLSSPSDGLTNVALTATLTWGARANADRYQVQLGTACGAGVELDTTATTVTIPGLVENSVYYWRVRARDACGQWGRYSACRTFRTRQVSGTDRVYFTVSPVWGRGQQAVELPVELENLSPLRDYDIALRLDPAVFEYVGFSLAGTRWEGAVQSGVSQNGGMQLHLTAAMSTGGCTASLTPGLGDAMRLILNVRPDAPLGPTAFDLISANSRQCPGGMLHPDMYDGGATILATTTGTGPGGERAARPARLQLDAGAPNPFARSTRMHFGLPRDAVVHVAVLDLAGRRVRTLHEGPLGAGWHDVTWNGTDDDGRALPHGVYFVRLRAADEQQTKCVVMAR